ncbi:MAG TPA: hypothetical protein VFX63_15260 [Pyrinomonadaceae bacterium]|nr:hypothetical protein [Pyrinomonadaceae bacterium]
MCLIHSIGGAFTKQPEDLNRSLSLKAADLIKRAFDDIDPSKLVDHHVHIAGLGVGGTNTFVNSKMLTWRHPFHRLKLKVYMSSAGVVDEGKADPQAVGAVSGEHQRSRQASVAGVRQALPQRWLGQSREDRVLCSE